MRKKWGWTVTVAAAAALIVVLAVSVAAMTATAGGKDGLDSMSAAAVDDAAAAVTAAGQEVGAGGSAAAAGADRGRLEAFAERIQEAFADRDQEALADLLAFPAHVETNNGKSWKIRDRAEFSGMSSDEIFGEELMKAIAHVDTTSLEMTAAGVAMGDGAADVVFTASAGGKFQITEIHQ